MTSGAMSQEPAGNAAVPDDLVQLCAFVVGGEEYVLDIMRISEILPAQKVTTVPHTPDYVTGVINLRGAIVPIVDLRERMGLPAAAPTRRTRLLVCKVGLRKVGLVVEAVTGVIRISRAAIKPAPALLLGSGPRFFLGICGGDPGAGSLKLLLNIKALLRSSEKVPDASVRAQALELP